MEIPSALVSGFSGSNFSHFKMPLENKVSETSKNGLRYNPMTRAYFSPHGPYFLICCLPKSLQNHPKMRHCLSSACSDMFLCRESGSERSIKKKPTAKFTKKPKHQTSQRISRNKHS